ncbi:MAG: FAD-dependent oxidoreductase [Rhodococcus sp. (in: high G+C Gram-positive bacteria)]|uniref:NAD(P)/FAD-dependent oxidoreductase n=1 Tax=Rhodococcus sp. TaxID=1831 RepID=UPI003BAF4A34
MTQRGVLVVGAGQASVQLACSLRPLGYTDPIRLCGAESHAPYQRPPLSKAFLAENTGPESLALRTDSFYASKDIDIRLDVCIEQINLGANGTGSALTSAGDRYDFEHLALTTGARSRRLAVPGAHLPQVMYLRTIDDAHRLRTVLPQAQRIVVVGGGFVGLEGAAVAQAAGKDVTVVEASERLLARAVPPQISEFYLRAHRQRGTRVLLGAAVGSILGTEAVSGVRLTSGEVIPADLVLVGIGAAPRTELAESLGLTCAGGIVVDAACRTSNPHVVSAGDCTVAPHPQDTAELVRLESVPNAIRQGHTAASTLLGRSDDTSAVPWFWSDQDTLKLQMAGTFANFDSYVLRGNPADESCAFLYYRDAKLIGVAAINKTIDFLAARKALDTGLHIPADRAACDDTKLKDISLALQPSF